MRDWNDQPEPADSSLKWKLAVFVMLFVMGLVGSVGIVLS